MTLPALQDITVYPHGGETKGSWILGAYAPGVPHPAFSYGYNNLSVQRPPDPSEWPAAVDASGEFYYVDSQHPSATDDSNPQGYPNQPRLTIPEGVFPAGAVVIVIGGAGYPVYTVGGDSRWTLTMPGTAANKCFFVGEGPQRPEIDKNVRITGSSHFITYGFKTSSKFEVWGPGAAADISSYITIRDWQFEATGTSLDPGPIAAQGYDAANKSTYFTVFGCDFRAYGDDGPLASENDRHAFKPEQDFNHIWYLGNTGTDLSGDCIQVGSAGTPEANRCQYVFIARNIMFDTMENAVDIKRAQYVIISTNLMYTFHRDNTNAQDTYAAIVVHDDPDHIYIINNLIYDTGFGMEISGSTNTAIVGNIIYNTRTINEAGYNGDSAFGDTAAIQYRGNTGTGYVVHNTCYNFSKGVQFAADLTVTCVNNIITGRNRADGHSMMWANNGDADSGTYDYNTYYEPTHSVSFDRGITTYTFAQWQALGFEANGQNQDPRLVDAANNDFNLLSDSPCRDSGVAINLYSEFLSTFSTLETGGYSIRIDIDRNNNIRGLTRGALEYAA